MAKEEVRLAGKHLGSTPAELLHVVHHMLPAVRLSQIHHGGTVDHRQAVAQMVVGHHHVSVGTEVAGKGGVASAVLRHSVGNLDHADNLAVIGRPLVDMNQCFSVTGRKIVL